MWYRVTIRRQPASAWEVYALPTTDPEILCRVVQLARQTAADLAVVQAESASELRGLVQRFLKGELEVAAHARYAAHTPYGLRSQREHMAVGATLDTRRALIEQGPGGDLDQPYHFELPENGQTQRAWLRLLARHWPAARQSGDGTQDHDA